MKEPKVVHVNSQNEVLGFVPKLEAHQRGILHRAVSVLIFNDQGDWLIQKRAIEKYHSGGLWSNTCCSHPYPDEDVQTAAERRLVEEMGMSCNLNEIFTFTYRAELDNDLVEHEFDHVFVGYSNESPSINEEEACDWEYISEEKLINDIAKNPDKYTEWFKILVNRVIIELDDRKKAS